MEFLDKISVSKEILDNMPKNNKRNREKYRKSLEELKEEYTKIKEEIYNEINKRYSEKVGQIKENPEIKKKKKSLVQMDENLFILNLKIKLNYNRLIIVFCFKILHISPYSANTICGRKYERVINWYGDWFCCWCSCMQG